MLKGSELPSVRALRSFIVVAQHLNFSKAAQELCLTQGAVSKQVATLEEMVGQPLFVRAVNGLELTESGKAYLPQVLQALEIIQHATISLRQSDHEQEQLVVDVPPSFASLWLVGKIEQFQVLHPNIDVKIRTKDSSPTRITDDFEISVRCLPIAKHYEHSQLLCRENLWLVAKDPSSDSLSLESIFANNALIPHTTRPQLWDYFTQQLNLQVPLTYHSVGFEHFYLSLEAVKRGKGLALVPDFLARESVKSGWVDHIHGQSIESGYGYYLSIPSYRLASRTVSLFSQWLEQTLVADN